MGLAYSSTSLAVMTLSEPAKQGRNASSLQLAEALGAAVLTAVAGTIFAGLHGPGPTSATYAPVTFAVVIGSMGVLSLVAIVASLRIGPIRLTVDQPVGAGEERHTDPAD